jgi:glycosyltransferase involved in cell wall biosynthesis
MNILVLLSTWNGSLYLKVQIDSILKQINTDNSIKILIRDDGSCDRTKEILHTYLLLYNNIKVIFGNNIGAKASFFELIELAVLEDADFISLADQDDYWDVNKISRAINLIGVSSRPIFYSSSLELVNSELHHISNYKHSGDRSFSSTLITNYATGCSCVFNRAFLMRIVLPSNINLILMHDWWLALLASAYNNVVYDELTFIKYRQHMGNQVGLSIGIYGFIKKIRNIIFAKKVPSRYTQATIFKKDLAGKLPKNIEFTLDLFINNYGSFFGRLKFVCSERKNLKLISSLKFIIFG